MMSTQVSLWSGDVSCLKLLPHQILLSGRTMDLLGITSLQTVQIVCNNTTKDKQLIFLECVMAPSFATKDDAACVQVWVLSTLGINHGENATISRVTFPSPVASNLPLLADEIHVRILASSPLTANSKHSSNKELGGGDTIANVGSVQEAFQRQLTVVLETIETEGGVDGVIQVNQLVPLQIFGQVYITKVLELKSNDQKLSIALYKRDISECPRVRFPASNQSLKRDQEEFKDDEAGKDILDADALEKRLWKLGLCGIHKQVQEILWYTTSIINPELFRDENCRNCLESARFRGILISGCGGSGKTELLNVTEKELVEHYKNTSAIHVDIVRWDATWLLLEFDAEKTNQTFFEFIQNKLESSLSGKSLQECRALILLDNFDELFVQDENNLQAEGPSVGNGILSLFNSLDELTACRICMVLTCQDDSMAKLPSKILHPSQIGKYFELAPPTESVRRDILALKLIKIPVCIEIECDEVSDSDLCERLSGMHLSQGGHQTFLNVEKICTLATRLASMTAGCVPRDLIRLCRHVLAQAFSDTNTTQAVKWSDVMDAVGAVKPSQFRHLDVNTPHIHPSSNLAFAGYEKLQTELHEVVDASFRPSEAMKRLGVMPSSGILLYGPSGCGKSLLAKVLAARANVNFVSIKSSEIMSKYFGDSEQAIRQVFARARSASPSILFFDEFDAVACKRFGEAQTKGSDAAAFDGSSVYNRILSTFLNEMDGIGHAKRSGYQAQKTENRKQVLVIAATNRVDALDQALIRPGRIDKKVFLHYPDLQDRKAILRLCTARMPLKDDVDLDVLASPSCGSPLTGADLANMCKEAALMALREDPEASHVENRHFQEALEKEMSSRPKEEI
uniref:Cell division cycle protein 48 putative n=1 Tax=Albugo laibachii Nc14 TaxID=890382 RepID=F0W6U9_9STRA|nr:cell division cycle protein 48 putative [Albugo laibachii Nc14]|eukprot:CCA16844.1 cell division cycle protein 48 putative [Albugo laibachii Nc14]